MINELNKASLNGLIFHWRILLGKIKSFITTQFPDCSLSWGQEIAQEGGFLHTIEGGIRIKIGSNVDEYSCF